MRPFFCPKKVYVIISHTEYQDGNKAVRIEKIMASKEKAQKKLDELNRNVTTSLNATMTTLKVSKLYFTFTEYDLE